VLTDTFDADIIYGQGELLILVEFDALKGQESGQPQNSHRIECFSIILQYITIIDFV
jgi:hypothetical protein